MLFYIRNKNIDAHYGSLLRLMNIVNTFDKSSGNDCYAIDLEKIDDLISLDSLLRMSNDYYKDLTIAGNQITINDGTIVV